MRLYEGRLQPMQRELCCSGRTQASQVARPAFICPYTHELKSGCQAMQWELIVLLRDTTGITSGAACFHMPICS